MFGNQKLDGFMHLPTAITYSYTCDYEDDNVKTNHFAIMPDGAEVSFDWSPYSNPTEADFVLWVELGMPARLTEGPLNRNDLLAYAAAKGDLIRGNVYPFGTDDYYADGRDFTKAEITVMQIKNKQLQLEELAQIEKEICGE